MLTVAAMTSQYKGLAELQEKYKKKGFEVLAFPCNQFGSQEPGEQSITPPTPLSVQRYFEALRHASA